MDDTFAQLEAEYCPPIDPPLLSAILSDYDLSDQKNVEGAKKTLDALKETALLEEQAGFDPSGTGASEEDNIAERGPESCPDASASLSRETEQTSLSNGVSSLDLEDDGLDDIAGLGGLEDAADIDKLDEETKVQALFDVFGKHTSRYNIRHTLSECSGKWSAALEELLNHVYLGELEEDKSGEKIIAKSIDAFAEENLTRRGRKGNAKNKRLRNADERRSLSMPVPHGESQSPQSNKWKHAAENVEFIAARTGIVAATVRSVYNERGASVSQTIAALLKDSMEESKYVVTDDEAVSSLAQELAVDFPPIALEYLAAIVRLTHPSKTAARELAEALSAKPKDAGHGGLQIITRFAPLSDVDAESNWSKVAKKTRSSASSRSPSLDASSAATRRDAYTLARAAALSQASAAHRKAKSDRLMGGAAAYYGQVYRENTALISSASAAVADEVAASQSTPTQLDLHGVDVANAKRIAQAKVEEWWNSLGESRVNGRIGAEDRQTGYRIVVGLGRHSEGGKGKLGPAVMKMLRQEGWNVEPAGAVLVVKGPMKR